MKGWREITIGGIITEPGNSVVNETGAWRSFRPIFSPERCAHCMLCWVYCPDGSILVQNSKVVGFNLNYCKGCRICAEECPWGAITMIEEEIAKKREEEDKQCV